MIRNHGGRQHANANAQKDVDRILSELDPGDKIYTEDVMKRLNAKTSARNYTPIRVGAILKTRSDLCRVGDGIWRVEAVPA